MNVSNHITNMEDRVLKEVKKIRELLSELVGTSELPTSQKFSKEALTKAAREFKKLSIERGEWLSDNEISKIIKNAPWRSGKFIIEKFEFANYFKRGHITYFNKKDLIDLNKELKLRNINIKDYIELTEDQAKFEKLVYNINLTKGSKKKMHFNIPDDLRDITSKPYSPPSEEIVRKEIESLMQDFTKFDLSEYIDLYYKKTYGSFKYDYTFDRYLKPELKKYCKDWCFKFNYANNALKKLLLIKAESIE